jgi:AraC-like DNA-binding protein
VEYALGDTKSAASRPRFVRSAVLQAFAEAARNLGLDPFHMLRRAGLPVGALDRSDDRIPADRLQALLADCAKSAASEEFGLLVGGAFRLSMKGPLGLLMREQVNVRMALNVLQRYLRYQGDNVEIRVVPQPDGLLIQPELMSARSRASRQMVELALAMYVQIFRGLLGPTWRPGRVAFAHAAPADTAPYEALLGPVEFGATCTGFLLSNADLATRLGEGDPQLTQEIARLIVAGGAPTDDTVGETVSALIRRLLPDGDCGVDRVAQHLGIDRRTVHRRLAAEGLSFTRLLDATRREVASRQLGHGDLPVGEVAGLVGFSSLSTFSRWFHQASGMQPSEYRREAQRR